MLAYPLLLFDFGGTLADVRPQREWLYVRACREFGVELDPARARITDDFGWEAYDTPQGPVHLAMSASETAWAEQKTAVLAGRLRRMGVTDAPLGAIAARILELDTDPEMYRVYEDVVPTLEKLRGGGYRMAVVSNHEWRLPELVSDLDLGAYFEEVVSSARVGYRKPHPEIFRFTLRQVGGRAEQALMIGDGISSDVAGALRMGIPAVLVDREGTSTPVDGVPVVNRLSDLLEFL